MFNAQTEVHLKRDLMAHMIPSDWSDVDALRLFEKEMLLRWCIRKLVYWWITFGWNQFMSGHCSCALMNWLAIGLIRLTNLHVDEVELISKQTFNGHEHETKSIRTSGEIFTWTRFNDFALRAEDKKFHCSASVSLDDNRATNTIAYGS